MENIDVQINLLNQSIGWLETYHGNNISEINRLKNFRRKLKTIKFAIEEDVQLQRMEKVKQENLT